MTTGDLAKKTGSGYDLLGNPGETYDLVPGENCDDCCPCECTEENDLICGATDEDYGTIVNHRSVQVDLALTASVASGSVTKINAACGGTPTITCPSGINGTYILDPVFIDAATDVCEGWYYKSVHSELNCHRTFSGHAQTICMLTWLDIGVRGFFPYNGTLPFNVVNITLQTWTAWVDDDYITSLDKEGYSSADSTTDLAALLAVMSAAVKIRSIDPLKTAVSLDTVRSWSMRFTGDPFPYKDVWRYILGGACREDCNEVAQIGPVDWVDVTEVTSSSASLNFGCDYDDNITAVQI